METNDPSQRDLIRDRLSIFPHRDLYGPADYQNRCPVGDYGGGSARGPSPLLLSVPLCNP
jgi:hypothetical protein